MKIFRKLYDWVLSWAEHPYGAWALFILSFAEASFFPIPPDPLLIALILGAQAKAFKFALNCTVASVLGAIAGYLLGGILWWAEPSIPSGFANFFYTNIPGFTPAAFEGVQAMFDQWNFWVVFTAGFTPIPFKLITIAAGACQINFLMFFIGALISRAARFFLVAWLIWKYGAQIKIFIDKYFNLISIAFVVLLLGGFLLIKYAL
ncbi:MAG: YqaA family protein [Bacteroidales bacterium]